LSDICFTQPGNVGYAVGENGKILKYLSSQGIGNANENLELNIFPNPAAEEINILFNKFIQPKTTLTIYNSVGAEVMRINNNPQQSCHFSRGTLPGGFYLIRIMQDNKFIASGKLLLTDLNK